MRRKMTIVTHHENVLRDVAQENDDRRIQCTSRTRVEWRRAGKCRSSDITKACCVTPRRKMSIVRHHENLLRDDAQENDDRQTSRKRVA
jgi:hypothetical protein